MNVVQLTRPEYTDVATALRNLASDIEAGAFGEPQTCAIALTWNDGDLCTLDIFGLGPMSSLPNVYLAFGRAMAMVASGDYG